MNRGTQQATPHRSTATTAVAAAGASLYTARGVSMSFGRTRALEAVDFACRSGQVHALLGANGAGKSTLVKILAGVLGPDAGEVRLDGRPVRFTSGRDATDAGVATVSQELNLFPDLSVLENLYVMREPLRAGVLAQRGEMRRRATPTLESVGIQPSLLDRPLRSLSLAARQLVEIARALMQDPRVLILDEPTSALKASDTRRLLNVVAEMKRRGVAVVFVTHFLEDALEVSDCVTVLRNGHVVHEEGPALELTPESVVGLMLGKAIETGETRKMTARSFPIPPAPKELGPLVLTNAASRGALEPLSITVNPGEIVGLAGLEASGASETLRMLFGQLKLTAGEVRLPTGGGAPRNMNAAARAGIAYVPADRKSDGLIVNQSICENVSMVTAGPLKRLGLLPGTSAKMARAEEWRNPIGLVMSSPRAAVAALSGGNQQKVVFAKWLEVAPSLVLLDDPSRGVDVGAKADMMEIIRAVANSGRVVIYASTDLDEMARLCDRAIIFYRRRAVGEMKAPLTEHVLLDAVTRGAIPSGKGLDVSPPVAAR